MATRHQLGKRDRKRLAELRSWVPSATLVGSSVALDDGYGPETFRHRTAGVSIKKALRAVTHKDCYGCNTGEH